MSTGPSTLAHQSGTAGTECSMSPSPTSHNDSPRHTQELRTTGRPACRSNVVSRAARPQVRPGNPGLPLPPGRGYGREQGPHIWRLPVAATILAAEDSGGSAVSGTAFWQPQRAVCSAAGSNPGTSPFLARPEQILTSDEERLRKQRHTAARRVPRRATDGGIRRLQPKCGGWLPPTVDTSERHSFRSTKYRGNGSSSIPGRSGAPFLREGARCRPGLDPGPTVLIGAGDSLPSMTHLPDDHLMIAMIVPQGNLHLAELDPVKHDLLAQL